MTSVEKKQLIRALQPIDKPKRWVLRIEKDEVWTTKNRDDAGRFTDARKYLKEKVPWISRVGYYKIESE